MNKAYEILCHCNPCPCSDFSVGCQKTIEQNILPAVRWSGAQQVSGLVLLADISPKIPFMDAENIHQVFDWLWTSGQLSERDIASLTDLGIEAVINLSPPNVIKRPIR